MPGSAPIDPLSVILSGSSAQAKKLKAGVEQAAAPGHPVLIYGEPGAGKESVARLIHHLMEDKNRFLAFNIPDESEEDFEKLLSRHSHLGQKSVGNKNTLYLEGVSELSSTSQRRLSTFLRRFSKQSGPVPKVIAGSTQDLLVLAKFGAFSRDLYWQLNVLPISVPNLAHRRADIPTIFRKLLALEYQGVKPPMLTREALKALAAYAWPGNMRELQNVVVRLRAAGLDKRITRRAIKAALANPLTPESGLGRGQNLSSAIYKNLEKYFSAHEDRLPPAGLYDRILKEVERPLLSLALKATRGNQLKAADLLGLNRNTLRKKMKNLDIRSNDLKS